MGLETAAIIGIAAAGAAAVGSVGSAIINSHAQSKANQANIDLMHEQMAYQTSEREAVQEYNLPEAQRARYEQAGFNPYLAMTNITSGNTEMQSGVQPAQIQPVNGLAQALEGLGRAPADVVSQMQNMQQVQATEEAVKQARIESMYKGKEKILQMQNLAADLSVKMSNVDKTSQEYKNLQKDYERIQNDIKRQQIDLNYQADFNDARNKRERNLADLAYNQSITEYYTSEAKRIEASYADRIGQANLNRINAAAAAEFASAAASHSLAHLNNERSISEFEMRVLNKAGVRLDNEAKEVANMYLGEQLRTAIDLSRSQIGKTENETNIFHYLGPAAIGAGLGAAGRMFAPARSVISGFGR